MNTNKSRVLAVTAIESPVADPLLIVPMAKRPVSEGDSATAGPIAVKLLLGAAEA